jgi:hypothetical protein
MRFCFWFWVAIAGLLTIPTTIFAGLAGLLDFVRSVFFECAEICSHAYHEACYRARKCRR